MVLTGDAYQETTPDASGNYHFTSLQPGGTYAVTVNYDPPTPEISVIQPIPGETLSGSESVQVEILGAVCEYLFDPPEYTYNGIDGDGATDIIDALLVAQYYVGLTLEGFLADQGDVDLSGTIDIMADINENPSFMLLVTQEWNMEYGFILLVPSDDPKIYRFEKKRSPNSVFQGYYLDIFFDFGDSVCTIIKGSASVDLNKVIGERDSITGFYLADLGTYLGASMYSALLIEEKENYFDFIVSSGFFSEQMRAYYETSNSYETYMQTGSFIKYDFTEHECILSDEKNESISLSKVASGLKHSPFSENY